MSAAVRALIGFSAIGGTVGVGCLGAYYLSNETIQSKLQANEFKLLSNESTEWKDILTNYTKNKELQFEGFTGPSGTETNTNDIEALKKKCQEALETKLSKVKDSKLFEKAQHWCTEPRQLSKILEKEGFKALNTDTKNTKEDGEWDKKLSEHAKENENTKSKKFTNEKLTTKEKATQAKDKRDAIKGECKKLETKKHYEESFKTDLEKAKLWCAIENKKN